MQRCYEQHMPGTPVGLTMIEADDHPDLAWGLDQSDQFATPEFRRWVTLADYSTETYLELLSTFSGHIALPPASRRALYACLTELLDSEYEGSVTRATLTQLCVARRR
jgi:hypothetical protein